MMINLRHQTIYNSGNDPLNITKKYSDCPGSAAYKKRAKIMFVFLNYSRNCASSL